MGRASLGTSARGICSHMQNVRDSLDTLRLCKDVSEVQVANIKRQNCRLLQNAKP